MSQLTFAFTPCPNDTFAFHALVHGLVDTPIRVQPVLLDIEELNRRAHDGAFDLTKLSVGAFAAVGHAVSAAAQRGARSGTASDRSSSLASRARSKRPSAVAWPSRVARPRRSDCSSSPRRISATCVEVRYDRILGAVERGEVDAGLIIHESRFTYADHGLKKVADLGDWWEAETGLPVPLAGICARADLDPALVDAAERAIRASVAYAFAHPEASRAFVRAHAQEMSDEVCDAHIRL